jgi:hypothetical protein
VSSLRLRAHLNVAIPSTFSASEATNPAFGYGAPHLSARGTLTLLNNVLLSAHFHIADQLPKTLKNVSALISSAERQSANLTIVEGPHTRILGFIIPMVFGTLPSNLCHVSQRWS